jgi:hypothetical protein
MHTYQFYLTGHSSFFKTLIVILVANADTVCYAMDVPHGAILLSPSVRMTPSDTIKPVSDPPTHILLHRRGQQERLLILDLFDIAESLGLPNVVSR